MELVAVAYLTKGIIKLLELKLAMLNFLTQTLHNLKKNGIIIFNLPLQYCKISE